LIHVSGNIIYTKYNFINKRYITRFILNIHQISLIFYSFRVIIFYSYTVIIFYSYFTEFLFSPKVYFKDIKITFIYHVYISLAQKYSKNLRRCVVQNDQTEDVATVIAATSGSSNAPTGCRRNRRYPARCAAARVCTARGCSPRAVSLPFLL